MKILITGSNGYIGKAVKEHYADHDLTLLHREVCELTDESQVDSFFDNLEAPCCPKSYDAVIHCAALGGNIIERDKPKVLHDNLKMFLNLHKHKDKFGKLIHFGSGAQYHEDTYYGLSKRVIADLCKTDDKFFNIIVYGLFDKNEIETRFIKSCINKCKEGKPIIVHKNKKMDFFHMEDLLILIDNIISVDEENKLQWIHATREYQAVYWEEFDLCSIARMVIGEMGSGEIILGEPGLDKPYTRTMKYYCEGSLLDRIKQTVGELK